MNTIQGEIKKKISYRLLIIALLFIAVTSIMALIVFIQDKHQFSQKLTQPISLNLKEIQNLAMVDNTLGLSYLLKRNNSKGVEYEYEDASQAKSEITSNFSYLFPKTLTYVYTIPNVNSQRLGYINIRVDLLDTEFFWFALYLSIGVFFTISTMFLIMLPLATSIPKKLFVDPVISIVDALDKNRVLANSRFPAEFTKIHNKLEQLLKVKEQSLLAEYAAEVAHDLQSSVTMINDVLRNGYESTQSGSGLNKLAMNAIGVIQNSLQDILEKHKQLSKDKSEQIDLQDATFVPKVIQQQILQKEREYGLENLSIKVNYSKLKLSNAFVLLSESKLNRVVSNIINNSIEASSAQSSIEINISSTVNYVKLTIADNGPGMSREVLDTLGRHLSTKHFGKGYGLASVLRIIKECGGNVNISTELGRGTIVELLLPKLKRKTLSLATIYYSSFSRFYIAVEDYNMSVNLMKKLSSVVSRERIKLLSMTESAKFDVSSKDIIICDEKNYMLFSQLDLSVPILKYIQDVDDCISRIEEERIFPVDYIELLEFNDLTVSPEYVLLDDDVNVTDYWENKALISGARFLSVKTFSELERVLPFLDNTSCEIFVDFNIGSEMNGLDVIEILKAKGFKNLYIATGESREYIDEQWWSIIRDKNPPFSRMID